MDTQCALSESKRNFLCHHKFIFYLENQRSWRVSPVWTWVEVWGIETPCGREASRGSTSCPRAPPPEERAGGCRGHRPAVCSWKAVSKGMCNTETRRQVSHPRVTV